MPRKRKAARDKKSSGATKRVKKQSILYEIPGEILDLILSYIIPDLTQLNYGADNYQGYLLFCQNIFYVSKYLRQRSLQLLHGLIWVQIDFPLEEMLDQFKEDLAELPLLYIGQHKHVLQAPTVKLTCRYNPSTFCNFNPAAYYSSTFTAHHTCILPFNFASLIRICDYVSRGPGNVGLAGLDIDCISMHGRAERDLRERVVPALSTLHDVSCLTLKRDGQEWISTDLEENIGRRVWNVNLMVERAQHILATADTLEQAGHADQSRMLLLSSAWLPEMAQGWLPDPEMWSLGELPHGGECSQFEHDYPGRCPTGNILRQCLFQIEQRACRSFVDLLQKFDWEWYVSYETLFGDPFERFIAGYEFTWFGASTLELAEMHYGRALVFEKVSRVWLPRRFSRGYLAYFQIPDFDEVPFSRNLYRVPRESSDDTSDGLPDDFSDSWEDCDDDDSDTDMSYGNDKDEFASAVELALACVLDPENAKYAEAYAALERRMSPGKLNRVQKECRARFVVLESLARKKNDRQAIWVGDWNSMLSWGGRQAATEWLPLAQKGLETGQSIEKWLTSNLSRKERGLYAQQGLLWSAT